MLNQELYNHLYTELNELGICNEWLEVRQQLEYKDEDDYELEEELEAELSKLENEIMEEWEKEGLTKEILTTILENMWDMY